MSRPLALLLLCALVATGCGAGDPEHVRIGVLGPLSGPRSWIGQQMEAGVAMAVEDINDAGGLLGKPVEMVVVDDADLTSIPGQLADLAERARVSVVIGPEAPGVLLGPRSPLTRRGVPALLPSAFAGDLDEAGSLVVRTVPSARSQAEVLGLWMHEQRGLDHVAILVADPVEGDAARVALEQGFRDAGVEVLATVSADGDAADLRPSITSLRAAVGSAAMRVSVDPAEVVVLLWGPPAAAARATTAARQIGWDVQLAVGSSSFAADFRTLAQEASEGVVLVFPFDWEWFSGPLVPWLIRYNARFGIGLLPQLETLVIDVPVVAVAAYDATLLAAEAVRRGGSRDPADVAAALGSIQVDGLLTDYDLSTRESWGADNLFVARFHEFALIFDVDDRLDLDQQLRFWQAQVSLDLFEDGEVPAAVKAIIDRVLRERSLNPPTYLPPLLAPEPVGRP